jgi:hypothetical protein
VELVEDVHLIYILQRRGISPPANKAAGSTPEVVDRG